MIPGVMVDFLGRATVAAAGTRDRDLVPHVYRVSGWAVEDDGETVLCLLPDDDALAECLADNGWFALTAEVIGPHETFQFKGHAVGTRAPVASDDAIVAACRERFVESVLRQYKGAFTREQLETGVRAPVVAVRFRVEEVFVQTPGPGAGRRLYPREAE